MEYILFAFAAVNTAVIIALFVKFGKNRGFDAEALKKSINETTQNSIKTLGEMLSANQKNTDEFQS